MYDVPQLKMTTVVVETFCNKNDRFYPRPTNVLQTFFKLMNINHKYKISTHILLQNLSRLNFRLLYELKLDRK